MAVEAHGGRKAGGRQAQGVTEVAVGSHGYVVARVGTTAKEGRVGGR